MGELKAPIGPNTAQLCIDMQRLFSEEGPWPMVWMPRVTPKVEQLVARAPERTIFMRFIPPDKPRPDLHPSRPGSRQSLEDRRPLPRTVRVEIGCIGP
jgi:nicotinamidase-related amidase